LKNPLVRVVGYGIFALSLVSFLTLLSRKQPHFEIYSLLGGYFLIFLLLATNTPPFSWINGLLRQVSPLFEQAFRVAFTKFSVAYVLGMAVGAGIGIGWIFSKLKSRWAGVTVSLFLFSFFIYYALPSLQGNLIYKNIKIAIPKDYFELFAYMKTQPGDGRIMNLPQGWNWGWSIYEWGYTGSGFLWYGIEQSIMDRAFDVWSPYNENYFWEVVRAFYAKDYEQFDSLIDKYDVNWILYDPTVIPYPGGRNNFYMQDLEEHLNKSNKVVLAKTFGKLQLYKVIKSSPTARVYDNLPNIGSQSFWNNYDRAFLDIGTYIYDPRGEVNFYYPFRSLFTNRRLSERDFSISKTSGGYIFSSKIPSNLKQNPQVFVQASSDETVVVKIKPQFRDNNTLDLTFIYFYPESSAAVNFPTTTWTVKYPKTGWLSLIIGEDEILLIADNKKMTSEMTLLLWKQAENSAYIVAEGTKVVAYQKIVMPPEPPATLEGSSDIKVYVPYVQREESYGEEYYCNYNSARDPSFFNHKSHDCEEVLSEDQPVKEEVDGKTLVFSSQNSERCFDIIFPSMLQRLGYVVEVTSKNVSGKPMHFSLINKQVEKTDFETVLPSEKVYKASYIIIPPMQADGLGYSLRFSNSSKSKEKTENYLKDLRVTPIPYTYLTQLKLVRFNDLNHFKEGKKVLVYSQAHDEGWLVFSGNNFLKDHVLVDNWANGWVIDGSIDTQNVKFIFWPQWLEWLGFGLLIVCFLFIFFAVK